MTDSNKRYEIPNSIPNTKGDITLPLIAVSGLVIYPGTVRPVPIHTHTAQAAIEAAQAQGGTVAIFTQSNPAAAPSMASLYPYGTEVSLRDIPHLDDIPSVLAHGRQRLELRAIQQETPYYVCQARIIPEDTTDPNPQTQAQMRAALTLFRRVIALNADIPGELLSYAREMDHCGPLADYIANALTLTPQERQRILATTNATERLQQVITLLGKEITMLELEEEIEFKVQQGIETEQREIYLREQMRVIQNELGETDIFEQEINDLRQRIFAAALPSDVQARALKEISRLMLLPPMAPEIGLLHNYIDWLITTPWHTTSTDNLDLAHAQAVLDEDHHGLSRVKDRVLEYIAVRQLAADKMQTPILCFLGPPGTGKTSLGKSIARALGREFVRVSLGGVRDEAEIRGHRRTYIGAMPGRIIQTMRRAGTINPVLMLDEIDKLGVDFHGDPAAALLEVLDPEQNTGFFDHYLDLPYDLSQVLFITTANDLDPLPPALEDRLEIIEFHGYIEEEKLAIARHFLIPRQIEGHGLASDSVTFETGALQTIIQEYTYEAGVRSLNRRIAEVLRKVARRTAEGKQPPRRISAAQLTKLLGPPDYTPLHANDEDQIGVVTGLAWTSNGGDVMTIEVSLLPGKGNLLLTGQLGEVMQESAQIALSYTRRIADQLEVDEDDFDNYDLHIHLPEGAIPKDGPSAGVTLAIAIISVFTEREVRSDVALTGEVTLRGQVIPVGGIREKVMAARRARIATIILPEQNQRDLVDVPRKALRGLTVIPVRDMQEIIDQVLLAPPTIRQRDQNRPDEDYESDDNGEDD